MLTRLPHSVAQIRTGISLQVASPAALVCRSFFVLLLTVAKSLRCDVIQLAGYIRPTTEEVTCKSRDPAPPPSTKKKKKKHSSLPLSSDFKRARGSGGEVSAAEGDGSSRQSPLALCSLFSALLVGLINRPKPLSICFGPQFVWKDTT